MLVNCDEIELLIIHANRTEFKRVSLEPLNFFVIIGWPSHISFMKKYPQTGTCCHLAVSYSINYLPNHSSVRQSKQRLLQLEPSPANL